MIIEKGIASFAKSPIPTKSPTHKCRTTPLPSHATQPRGKAKIAEVLMAVIFNIITNEVAI